MFATQADPIGQIDCDLQNIIICRSNNKCMIKNKKLMEPSYLNVMQQVVLDQMLS